MGEKDDLFREFGVEKGEGEKGEREKGERRSKMSSDEHEFEIRIRLNKFWIERTLYYAVILALAYFVIFSPFCDSGKDLEKKDDSSGKTLIQSAAVSASATQPKPEAKNDTNASADITKESTTEIKKENTTEIKAESAPKVISGNITLTIGDILLNKTESGKYRVESIFVSINNEYKIFTPKLRIFWYGETTEEAVKLKQKVEYKLPGAVPLATSKAVKLDSELTTHYLYEGDGDKKAYFKMELYDASDNSFLTTATKTLGIN